MHDETSIQSAFNRVSVMAKQRLMVFLRDKDPDFRESYLFRNDHVCGVKITAGAFVAKWHEGDAEIHFFRDQTALGTVLIDANRDQRAA